MKSILIPSKTYNLYVSGRRTFIHVPKDQEPELEKLIYGETVRIINVENENEYIDQIFWFLYSFKEVERFIFLSFKWDKDGNLHHKRMRNVRLELESVRNRDSNTYTIHVEKNFQKYLYHQIKAYSSFFFITDDIALTQSRLFYEDFVSGSDRDVIYVVINKLGIKTGVNLEEMIYVYSLVPIDLLYL